MLVYRNSTTGSFGFRWRQIRVRGAHGRVLYLLGKRACLNVSTGCGSMHFLVYEMQSWCWLLYFLSAHVAYRTMKVLYIEITKSNIPKDLRVTRIWSS